MVQTLTGMNFTLQGKRVFYITNNSTKTRAEYAEKCVKLGFPASEVGGRQIFLFYTQNNEKEITYKKLVYHRQTIYMSNVVKILLQFFTSFSSLKKEIFKRVLF